MDATVLGGIPLAICHGHMEAIVSEYRQHQFAEYKNKKLPLAARPKVYKYNKEDWASFADPYFSLCKLIDDAADFELLTRWVLEDYKKQNVLFVELIFSPDLARDNCGVVIQWKEMLRAAQRAITHAESDGAIKVSGIVTFLRGDDIKGQEALEYVQFVKNNKPELPNFRGFHLSGDEETYPDVEHFAPAYQLARENGYGCSVHAGETGRPENIWSALEYLNPHRIGHGIGAIKDLRLMEKLKKEEIPLEICVTSNFCMSNVDTLHHHPLPALMSENVICLFGNTDDDRLFNTSPIQEAMTLINIFGFTYDDILYNTRRIIERGFLPEDQKKELLTHIDQKYSLYRK